MFATDILFGVIWCPCFSGLLQGPLASLETSPAFARQPAHTSILALQSNKLNKLGKLPIISLMHFGYRTDACFENGEAVTQ